MDRRWWLVFMAALVFGACGDGGDGDAVPDREPTSETTTADTTPDTAAPPVTDPPVTDPLVTDPLVTDPPVTDPPVTDPPVTDPPVTDPMAPLAALVLRQDGLGSVSVGEDPDAVIDYVSSVLGAATADTGWVPSDTVALCPGDEYRGVEWGVLRLSFGDESPFASGQRHFTGWDYGIEGRLGEEPQGLITGSGVGLGTRVDELRDAYPDVQIFEGEEGLFSPSFYVNDRFDGFLTGTTDRDIITVMFGGYRCGG